MKMYFFRGHVPNFGDELNEWLLPKVFPDFFDQDDSTLFLGIGSILFDTHPKYARKIVFGSGYGGYTKPPVLDESWKVYCVRGPRTAAACGIDQAKVAGDAAILIRNFRSRASRPSIPCAFMPHWESVARGNWQRACDLAGVYFIDPRKPVEAVLEDIEASAVLITEAMHGAIVADALRVPWVPIQPFKADHRMKWFDWAEALDLTVHHHRIWASSTQEAWVARSQGSARRIQQATGVVKLAVGMLDAMFVRLAAAGLRRAGKLEPMLSSDHAITAATDRLRADAARILHDFGRGGRMHHAS